MTKHGLSKTRFYGAWVHMKSRCHNEKDKDFYRYGAKGIVVCEDWHDFINFRDDLYSSYLKHVEAHGERQTTLDRIDNNKGYEPNNCRWATWEQQNQNKKSNKMFIATDPLGNTYKHKVVRAFAREHGLMFSHVRNCLIGERKHHKQWTFKYLED